MKKNIFILTVYLQLVAVVYSQTPCAQNIQSNATLTQCAQDYAAIAVNTDNANTFCSSNCPQMLASVYSECTSTADIADAILFQCARDARGRYCIAVQLDSSNLLVNAATSCVGNTDCSGSCRAALQDVGCCLLGFGAAAISNLPIGQCGFEACAVPFNINEEGTTESDDSSTTSSAPAGVCQCPPGDIPSLDQSASQCVQSVVTPETVQCVAQWAELLAGNVTRCDFCADTVFDCVQELRDAFFSCQSGESGAAISSYCGRTERRGPCADPLISLDPAAVECVNSNQGETNQQCLAFWRQHTQGTLTREEFCDIRDPVNCADFLSEEFSVHCNSPQSGDAISCYCDPLTTTTEALTESCEFPDLEGAAYSCVSGGDCGEFNQRCVELWKRHAEGDLSREEFCDAGEPVSCAEFLREEFSSRCLSPDLGDALYCYCQGSHASAIFTAMPAMAIVIIAICCLWL